MVRLARLLVLPTALAFVPSRSSVQRCSVARYQSPEKEEDPAFKYYSRQEYDETNDENTTVTREMQWRDLLQDPQVKRRNSKGGGGYKTMDNRDSLPFVAVSYTHLTLPTTILV